jgi:DNA-binding MarR family transcriptional regulator
MTVSSNQGRELQTINEIDRVIHEPARLLILAYLYVAEAADFIFLMRQIGLTKGNLSSHMIKLEEAGYIEVVKEFVDRKPRTLLRITHAGQAALQAYRQNMEQVLEHLPR